MNKVLNNKNVIKIDIFSTVNRPEKNKSGFYLAYIVEIELGDFE
jgi:hypothetical protein